MHAYLSTHLRFRLLRAGGHLALSLLAVALVAILVFGLWYPEPFRTLSGGLHLFLILILVDVTLGPLATAVVSRPGKSSREWRMDVSLIVLLQLAALGYGLWTLYQARPVYLAFEIDRYRAVHAVDVVQERLHQAPERMQQLPLWGPKQVAVRPFANSNESYEANLAALQGVELSFRPDLWMPYEDASDAVRGALKPISELLSLHPEVAESLEAGLGRHKLTSDQVAFLPLHARTAFWTAVVNTDSLQPVLFLDVDPYNP